MMLATLEIELQPCGTDWPVASMGSLFHGWLMEKVPGSYAEELHRPGLKPFSQYLDIKPGRVIWRISTLNEEAYRNIALPLLENPPREVDVKAKNLAFPVAQITAGKSLSSYKELADYCYTGAQPARKLVFRTATPAAFRSGGQYLIFPSEFHVMQSLITRWNAFADAVSLEDDQILPALAQGLMIIRYRLESRLFHLEGTKIPGFAGEWEMRIKGPDPLQRLAAMLGMYAEFTGIGIKTSLGMGGVRTKLNAG